MALSLVSTIGDGNVAGFRSRPPGASNLKSVLIVDDDAALGSMIREYLERHDIHLDIRHNGQSGLEAAITGSYDLMLLDVMLPDLNGFEVLEQLREKTDLSVLLLSARGEPADRIRGLRAGADDYLPKPFDPDELVARIHAVIRRTGGRAVAQPPVLRSQENRIRVGDLLVDKGARTAWYRAAKLDLTDIEFALLQTFAISAGVVLTREELVENLFAREFHPLNRNLDMHVSRLRKKLDAVGITENPIRTVRSLGYMFSPEGL
jgi:two-component system response regulator CpxR